MGERASERERKRERERERQREKVIREGDVGDKSIIPRVLPALPNSQSNPDPRSTRCTIATSFATEAEAVPRGRRQKSATQGNVFFPAAAGAVDEEEGTRVVGAEEGSCEFEGTRVVVESCEGVMIMLWGGGGGLMVRTRMMKG